MQQTPAAGTKITVNAPGLPIHGCTGTVAEALHDHSRFLIVELEGGHDPMRAVLHREDVEPVALEPTDG